VLTFFVICLNNRMDHNGIDEEINSTITPESGLTRATNSTAWAHYTKILGNDNKVVRARCNYCGNEYKADSGTGTSNLRRHLM
jgi:BED zinc finger